MNRSLLSLTPLSCFWKFCVMFLIGVHVSCDDFLDANLSNSLITADNIFTNDVTANAAVTGMYNSIINLSPMSGTPTGMNALAGLSSGELFNYPRSIDLLPFEQHQLISSNGNIASLWRFSYNLIYQSNTIIDGLQNAHGLSSDIAQQLEGEARFMRAFTYFYLLNLFGDVPLATDPDYRKNQWLPREPVDRVYDIVESDLRTAKLLLSSRYVTNNRARPNKSTATALLARVFLYQQRYQEAEAEASMVLSDSAYALTEDLNKTFLIDSKETIWQLMPVNPALNTPEGFYFILIGTPKYNVLSPSVVRHFESGDARLTYWTSSYTNSRGTFYFPYKYKKGTKLPTDDLSEYSVVLRLAEMYLIRAEARANLNNVLGAQSDLNAVRHRAGLPDISASDQQSLLVAIENERLSELFTEYAHRWFDLKRTGRLISILVGDITTDDLLYPIPLSEFQKNPKLGSQNTGY